MVTDHAEEVLPIGRIVQHHLLVFLAEPNIPRLPKSPLDVLLQPLQCFVCLDNGRPGRPSLLFVKTPQPRLPREVHHFADFTEEDPTV